MVTGLIAQQSTQSVVAATGDPLTAGNAFTETSIFILKNTSGTVSAPPRVTTGGDAAVFQATDGAIGVTGYGYGHGNGVYGVSDNGSGAVKGVCNPDSATGLSGRYGVLGQVNIPMVPACTEKRTQGLPASVSRYVLRRAEEALR